MTEHTPTPWRYDEFLACLIEGGNGAPIRGPIDAAFIVKAVNNHDEALEIIEALLGLELGSSERAMAFLSRVGGVREP